MQVCKCVFVRVHVRVSKFKCVHVCAYVCVHSTRNGLHNHP
jgi:hypothetical protein